MQVEAVLTALLSAAILSSMPLMLAAVGESIGERAGLLNLGVEGVMLLGGFAGFWIALESGSTEAGLLAGIGVGILLGCGFGALAVYGHADQVVLGLGLTLAGTGGTTFLFREMFGSEQPLMSNGVGRPFEGWLEWLPVVGPAIGQQRWFVFVAIALAVAAQWVLARTRYGLMIRAAGESPIGLEAVGGDVQRVRIVAAIVAGAFSGLAGAAMALVELGFFLPGMTLGAGFLAIALTMLGRRDPLRVALLALAFGVLTGLDTGLQVAGVDIRPEFLQMAPYLGIVIALVLLGRHVRSPRALGQPYRGLESNR